MNSRPKISQLMKKKWRKKLGVKTFTKCERLR